jgi:hypothetical protein
LELQKGAGKEPPQAFFSCGKHLSRSEYKQIPPGLPFSSTETVFKLRSAFRDDYSVRKIFAKPL